MVKAYKRRFTPHAAGLISQLVPQIKTAIRSLCDLLLENPFMGKSLSRELAGFYSIRHNRYRVIYRVDPANRLIIIEFVGRRDNVYDLFSQLIKTRKNKI